MVVVVVGGCSVVYSVVEVYEYNSICIVGVVVNNGVSISITTTHHTPYIATTILYYTTPLLPDNLRNGVGGGIGSKLTFMGVGVLLVAAVPPVNVLEIVLCLVSSGNADGSNEVVARSKIFFSIVKYVPVVVVVVVAVVVVECKYK